MKAAGRQGEDDTAVYLREVTLIANPAQLRVLAQFISEAAAELETSGDLFEHRHWRDCWPDWREDYVDVIVHNANRQ